MQIIKGTNRIAFVGKRYAFKVPKVTPRMLVQDVYDSFAGTWHGLTHAKLKDIFAGRSNTTPRAESLEGIRANILEKRFSSKLGDIVVPTRFSLFGVVNVMDAAAPSGIPASLIAKTRPFSPLDGHPVNSADNFGIHNGRLKLLNYGGIGLISYIMWNKDIFRRQLDDLGWGGR